MVALIALAVTAVFTAPAGAAAAPAPGAPAGGSIGLRLLDAPVASQNDPRARVYIVDHLAPGTTISRRVEVSNTTNSTTHIALYPAAASIEHGSFLGAAGNTPNDLTTWTSVTPGELDVPAGGHATATVKIVVPRDAAPGEQYGVVWAEARSAPATGGGVVQVSRVGIRLYLSVGPGGAPAPKFTIDSLTAARTPGGQPMVLASVRNTGGRALDLNGVLQLSSGPGGLSAGPFPAKLGTTLAIGDTENVTVALDQQLPAGPWQAKISLRSGLIEHSAAAAITFPAAGASAPVKPSRSMPWLLLAIGGLVVLLLLGIIAALVVRRRRRQHRGSAGPVPTPQAVGTA